MGFAVIVEMRGSGKGGGLKFVDIGGNNTSNLTCCYRGGGRFILVESAESGVGK